MVLITLPAWDSTVMEHNCESCLEGSLLEPMNEAFYGGEWGRDCRPQANASPLTEVEKARASPQEASEKLFLRVFLTDEKHTG